MRTPENVQRVRVAFRRSVIRHSRVLNLSERSVRRILHVDLHFHPYKLQVTHDLTERHKLMRVQYCQQILQLFDEHHDFDKCLTMSDEANFSLNGCVNKQNFRYWASQNPQIREEIANVTPDMLPRMMSSVQGRLQQCVDANGGHLKDIIFKT